MIIQSRQSLDSRPVHRLHRWLFLTEKSQMCFLMGRFPWMRIMETKEFCRDLSTYIRMGHTVLIPTMPSRRD